MPIGSSAFLCSTCPIPNQCNDHDGVTETNRYRHIRKSLESITQYPEPTITTISTTPGSQHHPRDTRKTTSMHIRTMLEQRNADTRLSDAMRLSESRDSWMCGYTLDYRCTSFFPGCVLCTSIFNTLLCVPLCQSWQSWQSWRSCNAPRRLLLLWFVMLNYCFESRNVQQISSSGYIVQHIS